MIFGSVTGNNRSSLATPGPCVDCRRVGGDLVVLERKSGYSVHFRLSSVERQELRLGRGIHRSKTTCERLMGLYGTSGSNAGN